MKYLKKYKELMDLDKETEKLKIKLDKVEDEYNNSQNKKNKKARELRKYILTTINDLYMKYRDKLAEHLVFNEGTGDESEMYIFILPKSIKLYNNDFKYLECLDKREFYLATSMDHEGDVNYADLDFDDLDLEMQIEIMEMFQDEELMKAAKNINQMGLL